MKKLGKIKLKIEGSKANPSPPIGSMLGQKGLNIIDFCKKFNNLTINYNYLVPVVIHYYKDNSYNFYIKKPLVSDIIKDKFNIKKFNNILINIDFFFILDIIKIKLTDLNTINLYNSYKIILGNIRSIKGLNYEFKI